MFPLLQNYLAIIQEYLQSQKSNPSTNSKRARGLLIRKRRKRIIRLKNATILYPIIITNSNNERCEGCVCSKDATSKM